MEARLLLGNISASSPMPLALGTAAAGAAGWGAPAVAWEGSAGGCWGGRVEAASSGAGAERAVGNAEGGSKEGADKV